MGSKTRKSTRAPASAGAAPSSKPPDKFEGFTAAERVTVGATSPPDPYTNSDEVAESNPFIGSSAQSTLEQVACVLELLDELHNRPADADGDERAAAGECYILRAAQDALRKQARALYHYTRGASRG